MKAAIYARVSTEEQNTDLQTATLKNYCELRGLKIGEIYTDVGQSGAAVSRPALDALMGDARRRRFDTVVVWKFDRFARSTQHLLAALQEFRAMGIEFISYTEGIDTATPAGKMVFTFLAAVAEFERELIRERVRAGISAARARGKRHGRPKVPADAQEVLRLRALGHSWAIVCKQTGLSKGTAQRALRGQI